MKQKMCMQALRKHNVYKEKESNSHTNNTVLICLFESSYICNINRNKAKVNVLFISLIINLRKQTILSRILVSFKREICSYFNIFWTTKVLLSNQMIQSGNDEQKYIPLISTWMVNELNKRTKEVHWKH